MEAGPFFLIGDEKSAVRLRRFLGRYGWAWGQTLPDDVSRYSAIYQWGKSACALLSANSKKTSTIKEHVRWFNRQTELQRLEDLRLTEKRLKLHGLHPALLGAKPPYASLSTKAAVYRVFVSHLEALIAYRGMAPLQMDMNRRFDRQLCRLAIRVVYALGLEFAEVGLVPGAYCFYVVHIDPAPQLSEEAEQLWAAQIKTELAGMRTDENGRTPLVIGSDCELLLCRDGARVVFANRYFTRFGRIGCDGWRDRRRGMIYPLAELRPRPQSDAVSLIKEIRRTMHKAVLQVDDDRVEWRAGGMPKPGFALGGHLHFSGVRLTTRLLVALDNYLALPLVMVEREEERARRPRYGFLGDFRRKTHGGFEYRTLSSWLVTPRLAMAVCSLALFIAQYHDELKQNPLDALPLQEAYYSGDKAVLHKAVASLWEELRTLKSFRPYEAAARPLMERALSFKPWPSERDVRKFWKIRPYAIMR